MRCFNKKNTCRQDSSVTWTVTSGAKKECTSPTTQTRVLPSHKCHCAAAYVMCFSIATWWVRPSVTVPGESMYRVVCSADLQPVVYLHVHDNHCVNHVHATGWRTGDREHQYYPVCDINKLPLFAGVFSTPQSSCTTASLPYTFNVYHCTFGGYALEALQKKLIHSTGSAPGIFGANL